WSRHLASDSDRPCGADARAGAPGLDLQSAATAGGAHGERRMYVWLKAFHVIAIIAWMAGMLYLPRLFVYHCEAEPGSKQSETFKVMERRLLKAIINPAMILTWLLGLYLAWANHWFSAGWLHVKLLLVIVLSGIHGFFARCVRDF